LKDRRKVNENNGVLLLKSYRYILYIYSRKTVAHVVSPHFHCRSRTPSHSLVRSFQRVPYAAQIDFLSSLSQTYHWIGINANSRSIDQCGYCWSYNAQCVHYTYVTSRCRNTDTRTYVIKIEGRKSNGKHITKYWWYIIDFIYIQTRRVVTCKCVQNKRSQSNTAAFTRKRHVPIL